MKKRIFSLVLAVLMLFSFNMGARAESMVQPRYSYTNSVDASISFRSGQLTCSGNIVGKKGTTTRIQYQLILQKKGVLKWNTVTTWSDSVSSYETTDTKHYGPVDSGKYRVKVEATVYAGTSSETVSATSSTETV